MYLDHRESSLGGYTTVELQFSSLQVPAERMTVLAYIALPCNPLFLGAAPLETIALQIAHSHGHSGHNVEYLAKLSAFMTLHVPRQVHYDHHLMALETLVLEYVRSHKPDLLHHFQTALADVPVFERERFSALPPSLQVQEASRGETFLIAMRNQAKDHEPKRKQEDFVEEKTAGKSFTPSSPSKKHFSESFIKEQFSALLTESVYFN